MFKLQSHLKAPNARRKVGTPTGAEQTAFRAYQTAYRRVYGHVLTQGGFSVDSRAMQFLDPSGHAVTIAGAARCKELTRQLKFRMEVT